MVRAPAAEETLNLLFVSVDVVVVFTTVMTLVFIGGRRLGAGVEPQVLHQQRQDQDGHAEGNGHGQQRCHGLLVGADDGEALGAAPGVGRGDNDARVDGGGVLAGGLGQV